jgi:hypothetical protein
MGKADYTVSVRPTITDNAFTQTMQKLVLLFIDQFPPLIANNPKIMTLRATPIMDLPGCITVGTLTIL